MQNRRITHTLAILCSSIVSMLPHAQGAKSEGSSYSKKLRDSSQTKQEPRAASDPTVTAEAPPEPAEKFPWRKNIVTTTFWVGEAPTQNNPVPNHMSSWDMKWASNYGGTDTPDKTQRNSDYHPASFKPGQNPFYIALPYNDLTRTGYKPEASSKIPWFAEAVADEDRGHKSVLKGRWIAIRFGDKVAYAQWEDCGPFRTDHADYVFGTERPKPNLNKGAGLDVSPAVRDFLGMADTDVTDWKFVEFDEVPEGPWAKIGENNTFVQNSRKNAERLAQNKPEAPVTLRN